MGSRKKPKKPLKTAGERCLRHPSPLFFAVFTGNYQRVICVRGRNLGFWRHGQCKEQRDLRFILVLACEASDALIYRVGDEIVNKIVISPI
jgi:hypothetical protein